MRTLNGQPKISPHEFFENISSYLADTPLEHDKYGSGGDKENFEQTVADDFGYEAAIFMPSGVMAQLIAMRIVRDETGNHTFAMHSTSHLEMHEQNSYSKLHNLEACLVGTPDKVPVASDIDKIQRPVSALIHELPMRHLGGALPSWNELEQIKAICQQKNIHLHIDGARLWETSSYYNRTLPDITRGAQSCYISFYKGIGSTSGAMLMGTTSFIEKAKPWLRRHGGDLYQLSALWIPAKYYYEKNIGRFDDYYQSAQNIAKELIAIENIEVTPFPPQTNMMHVLIKGDPDELRAKMTEFDKKLGYSCLLSCWGKDSHKHKMTRFELYVGENARDISMQEITAYFSQLTS